MSWKFVLNANNMNGRDLKEVAEKTCAIGYEFFTIDGFVYFVNSNSLFYQLNITVEDLY